MSQTDKKDTKDTKESETHKDKDEKKDEAKAEREKLLAAQKVIRLGDIAPDFTAVTKDNDKFNFYEYLGESWGILFSHPKDFTPVCTTELGRVTKLIPEFKSRNVKVCALSVDNKQNHSSWIKDIDELSGEELSYPLIADSDKKVSLLYGMLDQSHLSQTGLPFTVRAVFIIDPKRVVRLILTYPASTGRNFNEILRVLDSLQLADKSKVATPADWKKGDKVIILPSVSNEDAQKLFPKGFKTVKSYLRYVDDPSAAASGN